MYVLCIVQFITTIPSATAWWHIASQKISNLNMVKVRLKSAQNYGEGLNETRTVHAKHIIQCKQKFMKNTHLFVKFTRQTA